MCDNLLPSRHVCGEIVQVDLSSDYPMFYRRDNVRGTGRPILSCPRCEYPLTMDWMIHLYYVEPMPSDVAVRTEGKVCSNCWGQLAMTPDRITVIDDETGLPMSYRMVLCLECKWDTRGYVTHRYVGTARERDYTNYGNAIIGLSEALELEQESLPFKLPEKREKLSIKDNLAMLGY